MKNLNNIDHRTQKQLTGDLGEKIACKYLENFGYRIVDRNFACKTGEIDIIAIHSVDKIISFVEVKSRNSIRYGLPCQAVSIQKQQRIKKTSEFYRLCHPCYQKLQPSFDVIEILRLNDSTYVRHLKNAF